MKSTLIEILTAAAYHGTGIAPIGSPRDDVNRLLADLPPEEARRMRRKFRKVWRSIAHAAARDAERTGRRRSGVLATEMGLGVTDPGRYVRKNRKAAVKRAVTDRVVLPALSEVGS